MDHLRRCLGLNATSLHVGIEQVRVSTRCSFVEQTLAEMPAQRELGVSVPAKAEGQMTGTAA
jgi:hypothetical protein